MKIEYDENICVRCAACVTESENGGVIFIDGKIIFDCTCSEDWATIAEICPVGAISIIENKKTDIRF